MQDVTVNGDVSKTDCQSRLSGPPERAAKVIDLTARIRERDQPAACAECDCVYDPVFLEPHELATGKVCWDCADKLEVRYLEVAR